MEKLLSEITREEWIGYNWVEVTSMGTERTFLADGGRTPNEAAQAREDWDSTAVERDIQLKVHITEE